MGNGWVNANGDVAHPDSPRGGGGPGFFGGANPTGTQGGGSEVVADPFSPTGRRTVLDDQDEKALELDSKPPVPKVVKPQAVLSADVKKGAEALVGQAPIGSGECYDLVDKVLTEAGAKSCAGFRDDHGERGLQVGHGGGEPGGHQGGGCVAVAESRLQGGDGDEDGDDAAGAGEHAGRGGAVEGDFVEAAAPHGGGDGGERGRVVYDRGAEPGGSGHGSEIHDDSAEHAVLEGEPDGANAAGGAEERAGAGAVQGGDDGDDDDHGGGDDMGVSGEGEGLRAGTARSRRTQRGGARTKSSSPQSHRATETSQRFWEGEILSGKQDVVG